MMGLLNLGFALHYEQMLRRKLEAMTEADWKAIREEARINEEWAEHNPSVFARSSRDPLEFKHRLVSVLAGPLGYYGSVQKLFIGPRRDTIEEAKSDADLAAEWTLQGGFAGLQHVFSELSRTG